MSVDAQAGDVSTVVTRRWPRRVAVGGATMAILVVASTAAGGWYYADELLLVRRDPTEYPIAVVAVDGSVVTLAGDGADEPGLLGLEWADDHGRLRYARVGPDVHRTTAGVVRDLIAYPDVPPPGAKVRLDGYAAPADAAAFARVSGLPAETVEFAGPLGRYPATYVPAFSARRRWAIHVHGRGANRAEGYRLMPAVHELGYSQLSISYRNDAEAPVAPTSAYGLGWTECADLAAAVEFVRERGATDVVLVGYSMGAAVVGNYLRTQGSAGVAGVVYDSPALSWPDILAFQARDRGLPAFGAAVAAGVVRARTRIRLDLMDQVAHADRLDVPVLLFHGTADPTVPVTSSDTFAAARPDLVTYVRTDARHVRSWNVDAMRYEAALQTFLRSLR